jgi:branched-chain amino acid transport system ATP-binding protein
MPRRLRVRRDTWHDACARRHAGHHDPQRQRGLKQRALEIGITTAGGADVILFDEPTAGMSHAETERAVELIRRLTEGRTLVIVEHDMSVVFGLADRISVLVYGQIIASGTPDEIRRDPKVKEAYLGAEAA